jgi:hypothetical protein
MGINLIRISKNSPFADVTFHCNAIYNHAICNHHAYDRNASVQRLRGIFSAPEYNKSDRLSLKRVP